MNQLAILYSQKFDYHSGRVAGYGKAHIANPEKTETALCGRDTTGYMPSHLRFRSGGPTHVVSGDISEKDYICARCRKVYAEMPYKPGDEVTVWMNNTALVGKVTGVNAVGIDVELIAPYEIKAGILLQTLTVEHDTVKGRLRKAIKADPLFGIGYTVYTPFDKQGKIIAREYTVHGSWLYTVALYQAGTDRYNSKYTMRVPETQLTPRYEHRFWRVMAGQADCIPDSVCYYGTLADALVAGHAIRDVYTDMGHTVTSENASPEFAGMKLSNNVVITVEVHRTSSGEQDADLALEILNEEGE